MSKRTHVGFSLLLQHSPTGTDRHLLGLSHPAGAKVLRRRIPEGCTDMRLCRACGIGRVYQCLCQAEVSRLVKRKSSRVGLVARSLSQTTFLPSSPGPLEPHYRPQPGQDTQSQVTVLGGESAAGTSSRGEVAVGGQYMSSKRYSLA